MSSRYILLLLVVFCATSCQHGSSVDTSEDDSTSHGTLGPNEVEDWPLELSSRAGVFLVQVSSSAYEGDSAFSGYSWGGDVASPKTIVSKLSIFYSATELPVSRVFYSDLANLRKITASLDKGRLRIDLEGGDAHDSYSGTIECDERGIPRKRKVHSSEFPNQFYDVYEQHMTLIPEDE